MVHRHRTRAVQTLFAVLLVIAAQASAQHGAPNGEWPTYGGDLGHTRYSALDQIDAGTFNDLELAWRFNTANLGPGPEYIFQSTPLMVNGVLYTTAGTRRAAVALDATTGEMLWIHRLNEGARGAGAPRRLSGRGLTYSNDGDDGVNFYETPGYRLIALKALTGRRKTIWQALRPPRKKNRKAMCAASMRGPVSGSGSSTRSRPPTSWATTAGATTRGATPGTRASGAR